MQNSLDDQSIRALIETFVAGWNQQDGYALAEAFAEDADFTAITGLRASGRDLIARGHAEILSTIYAGTVLAADIRSIRLLRDDVAAVSVAFHFTTPSANEKLPTSTEALAVATQESGRWQIAVFQNMIPFARPKAGPLDRGEG